MKKALIATFCPQCSSNQVMLSLLCLPYYKVAAD